MNTILCKLVTPEQANLFNSSLPVWFDPFWMTAAAELHRITPKILVCYKNDNPVAYLPVYEKRFVTLKKAYNPLMVYYSPIVFDYPDRKQPNRELLLEYEITKAMGDFLNKNYKRVLLNLNPEQYDIRGFKDAGLKATPLYTFITDLTSNFDFHIGEMTKLRKAEHQGYTFSQGFNPERMLELVYLMYTRKQHPFLEDKPGLLKLIGKLHERVLIEQYNVLKNDKIVSSILIVLGKGKTAYGWLTASDPDEMKKGANVMLWHELFRALSARYEKLDLCGANSKGPSRLKAALGAELKLFFQIIKLWF